MSQLTAQAGRSARLCAETNGAATAATSAVERRDFIVGEGDLDTGARILQVLKRVIEGSKVIEYKEDTIHKCKGPQPEVRATQWNARMGMQA